MSDFDARELIRQKIVSTFWILIKYSSKNDLHTCGTKKAHHAKNAFFVSVVRTYLGVRAISKFGIRAFQRFLPI